MATLVSPGVAVSVVDESAYASVGTGTVPLIVIATGENKSDVSGTGTAAYTTSTAANKLYLITSQRELIQYYGEPFFEQVSGTSLHGGERNEYGLLTAYSYLGLANRAYVLRADVDLDALASTTTEPKGPPNDNAYWLDIVNSSYGISEADANGNFVAKTPTVLTSAQVTGTGNSAAPTTSVGSVGDYAVLTLDSAGTSLNPIKYFLKTGSTTWTQIKQTLIQALGGAFASTKVTIAPYTNPPSSPNSGDIWIKSTTFNLGMNISFKKYNATSASFTSLTIPVLKDDTFATQPGTFNNGSLAIARAVVDTGTGDITSITIDNPGSGYTTAPTVRLAKASDGTTLATRTATATIDATGKVSAITLGGTAESAYTTQGSVVVELLGGATPTVYSNYIAFADENDPDFTFKFFDGTSTTSNPIPIGSAAWQLTNSATAITGASVNGRLWFDNTISANGSSIDLYKQDTGYWKPQTISSVGTTAPSGPSANDVWVDTTDLDNFPAIKVYDGAKWVLRDNTDQTTPNGVVFADITETASDTSNAGVGATLIDANSPNPVLYPSGMFAVNMTRTSNTVRKYVSAATTSWKWRNAAGNKADGSGFFGRKAVRKVIVQQLQSAVSSSEEIRSETVNYNLIACPGYPELADELSTLNVDRKETAFVLVDTPYRKSPQTIVNWMLGTGAVENGEDGLVSPKNAGMAVYYPSGLTTNLDGQTVLVPSSYVSLRTIAYSDSVSYPWFAPAGLTRGNVTNATNVGYLNTEDEFVPAALNEGQRDSLYTNKINPITNFPGTGIVVFGQKTLHPFDSSLDRVNVSRLVAYLRERFSVLARPFIFEPNDALTRENFKQVLDGFLQDIMSKRGIFDFAVVCDESNNTPARIDRNEMYADVAIEPTKAAEFIYIPVRLVNTGTL